MDEQTATAHTVIKIAPDGTAHVQRYGAAHEVEGSSELIELRPGQSITIRHLADAPDAA